MRAVTGLARADVPSAWHNHVMHLTGWHAIPEGYGAYFEVDKAPLWLRVLYRTPFLDRFAHPLLVRRGHGVLTPYPAGSMPSQDLPTGGWRIGGTATATGRSVGPLTQDRRP